MKKYAKAVPGKGIIASKVIQANDDYSKWPDEDFWREVDPDSAAFDNAWDMYLSDLEWSVNDALNVYPEPSTQGSRGGMFIMDNSGENEAIYVDFQHWVDIELDIAADSESADQYKKGYMEYLKDLIEYHWG